MPKEKRSVLFSYLRRLRHFLEELPVEGVVENPLVNKLRKAGQFLFLVVQGFVGNRCPTRAAALSYTTLLALVPLLAVMLSVSKNFLHDASAEVVPKLLDKAIAMVAPQLEYMPLDDETAGPPAPGQPMVSSQAREQTVEQIQSFIDKINAGTLGVVATLFLAFVAIRLLMTIEQTFNDIWGVERGRSIWRKVVYYWTTITLGPMLVMAAIYMTGRLEYSSVVGKLSVAPWIERFVLNLIPFVILWIGFALMYALMPNTHVRLRAAFMGGLVAGTLWQLNSMLSAMYVSRVITYSKIYGSLGLIPIFIVGLYFSWLIVLFGAQVSYGVQNIRAYLQQRAIEKIDQEGRELVACRIVLFACQNFLKGLQPPSIEETAERLRTPPQLLNRLVHRLIQGRVLSEVAGDRGGFQPAQPPESITVADVLHVVRSSNGTCGEPICANAGDVVGKLISDLYATERAAPANARFSDLSERMDQP